MRYLAVKAWERYQHYKDRDPPWIKLYRDTLTSEVWVLGNDTSRLVQMASTLLAARYGNKVPLKFALWRKVAHLDCDETAFERAIAHLAEYEFVEIHDVEKPAEQSASAPLAKRSSEAEQSRDRAEERESLPAPLAPRETNGVKHYGSNLCSSGEDIEAHLAAIRDQWRADYPDCNAPAFERWLAHLAGKGRDPSAAQRLLQARRLCQQGDHDAQLAVVDFSIEVGSCTLIPIADVRRRTGGSDAATKPTTRWRPKPGDDETALEVSRAGR